jgi:PKD repeat protein
MTPTADNSSATLRRLLRCLLAPHTAGARRAFPSPAPVHTHHGNPWSRQLRLPVQRCEVCDPPNASGFPAAILRSAQPRRVPGATLAPCLHHLARRALRLQARRHLSREVLRLSSQGHSATGPAADPWRLRRGRLLSFAIAVLVSALSGAPSTAANPPTRPATGDRQSGPAGTTTQQGPVVVFTSPGLKTVTLKVCNNAGCSTVTHQILVLQPEPSLISMTVAPARAEVGQQVLLEASASGRPPLSYSWQVLQNGWPFVQVQGPTAAWATAGFAPGAYTVLLTVANTDGTATAQRQVLLLPSTPTQYFTVVPCRALDTRSVGGPLLAGALRLAPIAGTCGVPASARAVALNVAAVAPTASGYLSVYPADYPHPLTSSVNFARGTTRAASTVMPLATDGSGEVAIIAALAAGAGSPSRVDLLLDVSGYFAPARGAAPQPLELQPRPCLLGFCEFATGTPVWFSQAFSGTIAQYRYDWTGSGVFTEESAQPVLSHSYAEAGFYLPVVEVSSSTGASATLAASYPIYVVPADPSSVPHPPASVTATFAGLVTFSTLDPTLGGSGQRLPSFALSVTGAPQNITGYDVYVSRSAGPFTLVAALPPDLTATYPLALAPIAPGETIRLQLAPLNYAGAGARSAPIVLQAP